MTITGLCFYPVKSCAGVATTATELDAQGLRWDRRWMVVAAETGRFLTQREYPAMARVAPEVADDGLTLSAPEVGVVFVRSRPDAELARRTVTVWGFTGEALDEGEEAADYLTAFFGFPCRLVRTPEDFTRRVNPEYGGSKDRVGFADGFAVLLASESSLADLNRRLPAPVPMDRFRPNVVVSGAEAWAEDGWRTLRTESGVAFRVAKPCARCAVTTVDQTRGEKTGAEPLATLAKFRRDAGGKVNFATNLIHERPGGVLRVGETLTAG